MQKPAETAVPIHPLLANRWSPRAYDENHNLSDAEVLAILEAGRWAPSSNNGQPWAFSVARREDALFRIISESALSGFNAAWAPRASAYFVISTTVLNAEGNPYKPAPFDAGLAAMSMVLQAEALGLATHQIGGFKADELAAALELEGKNLAPTIIITVGKAANPEILEGGALEREIGPRSRKALDEVVIHGLS
jgi:nitroreductase